MTKKSLTKRLYQNPPIIEAVINLGFSAASDFDISKLETTIREKYSKEYPNITREIQTEFQLESGVNPQSKATASQVGLCLVSADQKRIFKIQKDQFVFSRLKPYENWDLFQTEAKKLFMVCRNLFAIKSITRTAVRFINRFDLPGDSVELADYFNIFPCVSNDFRMRSLAMQVILDQPDIASTLIVSQALIPPLHPKTVSVLLDFDLFNQDTHSLDGIWDVLEKLHVRKNEIFENAITDKTRELIS